MPLQMQARSYKAALLTFQPKLAQPKLSVMEQAVREKRKKKKRVAGMGAALPTSATSLLTSRSGLVPLKISLWAYFVPARFQSALWKMQQWTTGKPFNYLRENVCAPGKSYRASPDRRNVVFIRAVGMAVQYNYFEKALHSGWLRGKAASVRLA